VPGTLFLDLTPPRETCEALGARPASSVLRPEYEEFGVGHTRDLLLQRRHGDVDASLSTLRRAGFRVPGRCAQHDVLSTRYSAGIVVAAVPDAESWSRRGGPKARLSAQAH
jgi:hypothetical protein